MYIDPNTGGLLFQALAVFLVCAPILVVVVGGGIVVYFIRKGSKQNQNSSKDTSSNP